MTPAIFSRAGFLHWTKMLSCRRLAVMERIRQARASADSPDELQLRKAAMASLLHERVTVYVLHVEVRTRSLSAPVCKCDDARWLSDH